MTNLTDNNPQDTEWYSGDEKPASKNVVSIVNNGVIDINALFNHPDYKSVPTPEGKALTVHITPIADNQTPEQDDSGDENPLAIISIQPNSISVKLGKRKFVWARAYDNLYCLYERPVDILPTDLADINKILRLHQMPEIPAQALEHSTDQPSFRWKQQQDTEAFNRFLKSL